MTKVAGTGARQAAHLKRRLCVRYPACCRSMLKSNLKDATVRPAFHCVYSTVTDFARFLGWSTSVPLSTAT
jgi:hypothetical protein